MAQDGKIKEIEEGTRKVFYVDVGEMDAKDAVRVLNKIRKSQGLSRVSSVWTDRILMALIVITAIAGALALSPDIIALLPL